MWRPEWRSRYCEMLVAGKPKVITPAQTNFPGPVQKSMQTILASCAVVLGRLSEGKEVGS
jgi:hypothetical protein